MAEKRTGYAPYSLTREAGVQSATVNGTIDVIQEIRPTINSGFLDEKGDWKGIKSSDENFFAFGKDVGIPNTGEILAPSQVGDRWPLDMTGFNDLFIAIKPTNAGNYAITAIMGPDVNNFANLNPVNPAATLKGTHGLIDTTLTSLFNDSADSLAADVWNIFKIGTVLAEQKLLQFKIVNNSGGESDIETAFMRVV
jgi:hypothetical protein